MSFEKLIWRYFSLVLNMNKRFSKSYIMPPLELTLDSIVINYNLLNTTCFTYAEDNFIRVTSLGDRRLTTPNITAQLNQSCEKCFNIHCEEKTLWNWSICQNCYQETTVEEAKQCLQWAKAHKNWTIELWNNVLWIDQSKFEIFGSNRRVYVEWRFVEWIVIPCVSNQP